MKTESRGNSGMVCYFSGGEGPINRAAVQLKMMIATIFKRYATTCSKQTFIIKRIQSLCITVPDHIIDDNV